MGGFLFCLFVGLIAAGCSGDAPANPNVASVPIAIGDVGHVKTLRIVPVSGTVVSPYEPTRVAFLVAGKVQESFFREGEFVRKGALMATLDPSAYRFAVDAATAAVRQARVAADRAGNEYERMAFLFERKSLARNDFEKFKAARDAAVLQLDQAVAAARVEKKRLADARLDAPVGGYVSRRLVEPGQSVAAGMPVFEIVRLDPVEILVGVPETDIHRVAVGQKTVVTLPAMPETTFEGTVRIINISADAGTRTYMTRISVPNPQHLMRLGMVAEAEIIGGGQRDAMTLPVDAIVRDPQGATQVFVYYPDQKRVYAKRVAVGALIGDGVEIMDGLSGDEAIVVAGQDRLRDGVPVSVVTGAGTVN
ncbi:RND transporter MFP subunit [Desulfosarcina ovata subsp. sediminis]|uniref:RND transporter MFP subunit n=2 Tax=Desulfosarcina ovata TaxID=83564 RepID=A0A5K8AA55_9BACT|nr:RND transporter MFP subunit [Desulfosarcina ovata subsp. sediminis]BBO89492.1 RND transporter MFP subunit [Desulfosarcina ovata subsp. ovata]